jgi:hypothetical protein
MYGQADFLGQYTHSIQSRFFIPSHLGLIVIDFPDSVPYLIKIIINE